MPTPFRSLFQAAVISSILKRNVARLLERRPATRFFWLFWLLLAFAQVIQHVERGVVTTRPVA